MNWMGNLQQFGRALMLPLIALPAAAILLRLGSFSWDAIGAAQFGHILTLCGEALFVYLPYIFAIGVAMGLTQNDSSAGMAALISYFLFIQIITFYDAPHEIGIAGGIAVGLLAAVSYHRFKNITFPEPIQLFGGPRFVPLFTSLTTIVLAYAYIPISEYVVTVGGKISDFILNLGGFGVFIYGVLHRLLVPTGLHHILNNVVLFQVGSYEMEDGSIVYGDLPRFFIGDPQAGIYMAGLYPIMMFALPAIAFAIIHEAREDLKGKVKAIFLTAALASFLTGVTEPIEFAFLFVAPILFIIHAMLSGFVMWFVYYLDIHHGFSFSAGALEFVLNEHLAKDALLLIPIGIVYGLGYYLFFRWAIRRFQLPTPGREDGSPLDAWSGEIPYRAPLIIEALGGKNNLLEVEACITRLRLTLANDRHIDHGALRHLGAAGIIKLGGGNVQVVFGTFSELIRAEMMKYLRKDLQHIHLHAPVQGQMIDLAEVPDRVFAKKIVGEGVAFMPERGELVAPLQGVVTHVHPSHHAVGITSEEGLEVLLHIGIDSSDVGDGLFEAHVQQGDQVQTGQLLIKFNLAQLRKHSKSIATPMVITNVHAVDTWHIAPFKAVKKGLTKVMSVVLKEEEQADGGKKDV